MPLQKSHTSLINTPNIETTDETIVVLENNKKDTINIGSRSNAPTVFTSTNSPPVRSSKSAMTSLREKIHPRQVAKHQFSQQDDSAVQDMLSKNMFRASFEENIVRRMKKYSKEIKVADKAHDFEMMHLSDQQPKLLINNWEVARKIEYRRQGVGGGTGAENTQGFSYRRPLKDNKTRLSPVFPIKAPRADCETDPLGLDEWNFRHTGMY